MPRFTLDEIRNKFSSGKDFNEIFDVFEDALKQGIQDVELYRLLFWNTALRPDELCLFGEKLAKEFPDLAYDTFMWLANVFEATYSSYDTLNWRCDTIVKQQRQSPMKCSHILMPPIVTNPT